MVPGWEVIDGHAEGAMIDLSLINAFCPGGLLQGQAHFNADYANKNGQMSLTIQDFAIEGVAKPHFGLKTALASPDSIFCRETSFATSSIEKKNGQNGKLLK